VQETRYAITRPWVNDEPQTFRAQGLDWLQGQNVGGFVGTPRIVRRPSLMSDGLPSRVRSGRFQKKAVSPLCFLCAAGYARYLWSERCMSWGRQLTVRGERTDRAEVGETSAKFLRCREMHRLYPERRAYPMESATKAQHATTLLALLCNCTVQDNLIADLRLWGKQGNTSSILGS
jgi:hypothetical protein